MLSCNRIPAAANMKPTLKCQIDRSEYGNSRLPLLTNIVKIL